MSPRNLPTRTRVSTSPPPAPALVLTGDVLPRLRTGQRRMVRDTECMRLPGNQLVLDGPMGQVGQIVALLKSKGEVVNATAGSPSLSGVMVTLTLTVPVAPGRTVPGRPPTSTGWSTRRKQVVFGVVLPVVVVSMAVFAWLFPLAALAVSVVLLLASGGIRVRRARQRHSNVPHVAIHHID